MSIPNDPIILLSYINMQLRDNYTSLDELCASLDIDCSELCGKLSDVGFVYDEATNQFK
ncbi:MAG: DUF4250 domain-containing protein [Muribaculaceae bacterium]